MTNNSLTARVTSSNEEVKNILILAGSIAHELRNYLTVIALCAEVTESRALDIKRSVKSADYLLSNLQLQMKYIASGESGVKDFRRSSISQSINESLTQYPFDIGERELITMETGETINNNDFEYFGNPVLTVHILYNLIKNSLRAIKSAGKGKVTIKLKPGTKYNQLIFKDTATGIPKGFLPKIFEPYESMTKAQGGTGIGLAFCKLIMKSYGGDIGCTSANGKFTEFTLKFPSI